MDLGLIKGGPAITTGNASNTDHDGDTTEKCLSWTTAEGKGKFIGNAVLSNNSYKDVLIELKDEAIYALFRLSKKCNHLLHSSHHRRYTWDSKEVVSLTDNFTVDL